MANTHMLYFTIRQSYDADIRHADIGFCVQSGQPCVQSRATQRHFTQTISPRKSTDLESTDLANKVCLESL